MASERFQKMLSNYQQKGYGGTFIPKKKKEPKIESRYQIQDPFKQATQDPTGFTRPPTSFMEQYRSPFKQATQDPVGFTRPSESIMQPYIQERKFREQIDREINTPQKKAEFERLKKLYAIGSGLASMAHGEYEDPTKRRLSEIAKKEHPWLHLGGQIGGYLQPGVLWSKASGAGLQALSRLAPSIAKRFSPVAGKTVANIGKKALGVGVQEGIAGLGLGATESVIKGENLEEAKRRASEYGLYGLAGGVLAGAGGELLKAGSGAVKKNVSKIFDDTAPRMDAPSQTYDEMYRQLSEEITPTQKLLPAGKQPLALREGAIPAQPIQLEPKSIGKGKKFKVANKELNNVVKEYETAIEKIQNYFGTNELRAGEQAVIKDRLGIDLDDIVKRMEKAESKVLLTQEEVEGIIPSAERARIRRQQIAETPTEKKVSEILRLQKQAKKIPPKRLLPRKEQYPTMQQKFRKETPFTATKSEVVNAAEIKRLSERAKIDFPDYDKVKPPSQVKKPVESVPMRDIDFDNVKTTKQLPQDVFGLESYIKTATERQKQGRRLDLQLFAKAKEKLIEVRKLRGLGEIGRKKERGFSINTKEDLNSPEKLRKAFDEDPLEYNVQSQKVLEKEAQNIMDGGFDNAMKRFYSTINDIDRTENVPLAKMLAREASRQGKDELAKEIISDMAERLTFAGRLNSAAKMLKDSTPQTYEVTVTKLMDRLNDLGRKQFGDKWIFKGKWKDINIPDDILKDIRNTKEFNEKIVQDLNERIYNHINENIPAKFVEKFNAWRRFAMLFNPTTHIRNILGNTFMNTARKSKDALASVIEKSIPQTQRTKSIGWSRDKALKNTVDNYYNSVKKELEYGGRWDINPLAAFDKALQKGYMMAGEKTIFSKGLPTKVIEKMRGKEMKQGVMEWLNKLSRDVLSAEDNFFVKRVYKDSLGQFMKARGIKEVTEEAHKYAMQEAFEATFKASYELVNFINRQKNKPFVGQIVESQFPFTKTPVNLFMRALEYSPLGLTKALFDKTQGKAAADVINSLSKGLTGSAVLTLGYMLADMGWARGKAALSMKEEEFARATGKQAYSIDTPLGSYTIDWAQPISTPLFMGVILNESLRDSKNGELTADRIYDSIAEGTNILFDQSFVKNLGQMLRSGKPAQEIAEYPIDLFEQSIPALLYKTSRAIDPARRETFAESPLEGLKKRTISKTPWSTTLEPKVGLFGEEEPSGGFVQQFLSPGYAKAKKSNVVTNELSRLQKTSEKSMFRDALPRMVDKRGLEPKQATQIQKMQGKNNFNDLQKLFKSNQYNKASDEVKLKAIRAITYDNYIEAKEDVLGKKTLTKQEKLERKKLNQQIKNLKKVVGGN